MTVARRLTCFKNKTCNILGFMEIIVYKIQPVGGWGYTISIPGPNGCSIKLNHNLLHMRIKSSLKTHARPSSETRGLNFSKQESLNQERSGSAVDCLTRDRGPQVQVSQASLCCVLEQEHNSYLSTGSTRKTCPYITEILLMGCKESNQTIKSIKILHFCKVPRAILVCIPAFRLLEAILAHRKK